jgi:hypothetical protein
VRLLIEEGSAQRTPNRVGYPRAFECPRCGRLFVWRRWNDELFVEREWFTYTPEEGKDSRGLFGLTESDMADEAKRLAEERIR